MQPDPAETVADKIVEVVLCNTWLIAAIQETFDGLVSRAFDESSTCDIEEGSKPTSSILSAYWLPQPCPTRPLKMLSDSRSQEENCSSCCGLCSRSHSHWREKSVPKERFQIYHTDSNKASKLISHHSGKAFDTRHHRGFQFVQRVVNYHQAGQRVILYGSILQRTYILEVAGLQWWRGKSNCKNGEPSLVTAKWQMFHGSNPIISVSFLPELQMPLLQAYVCSVQAKNQKESRPTRYCQVASCFLATYATDDIFADAQVKMINFRCQVRVKGYSNRTFGPNPNVADETTTRSVSNERLLKELDSPTDNVHKGWKQMSIGTGTRTSRSCLANYQSGSATLELRTCSWMGRTNVYNRHAHNVVNVESASSFRRFLEWVNDGLFTLQQLLTILERLVAATKQSSTELTSTTAINQISYYKASIDKDCSTSKCLRLSKSNLFICVHIHSFHNLLNDWTSKDPHKGHQVCNRRFSSPNGRDGNQRAL